MKQLIAYSPLAFALLVCNCGLTFGRNSNGVGYLAARPPASAAAPAQNKTLRIILMDTVDDQTDLNHSDAGTVPVDQFRKSIADSMLIAYRRTFPDAQVAPLPQDAGNEVLVWLARPQESQNMLMLAWRAEFLFDGRVVGELSGDNLGSTKVGKPDEVLSQTLTVTVETTYNTHMQVIGAFRNKAPPKTRRFLNRGRVFTVNGRDLTIASRMDFPGRMGQTFEIVDEKKKSIGKLKVQATYHTNFRAELLSGRAPAGAEVGVFVRQD